MPNPAPVSREELTKAFNGRTLVVQAIETLFRQYATTDNAVTTGVSATDLLADATVITLSPNSAFANERVLAFNPNQFSVVDGGAGGNLTLGLATPIGINGGYALTFNLDADTSVDLPTEGRVPSSADGPYADDAAAAAAGVSVGQWYAKTGGTVVWRVA